MRNVLMVVLLGGLLGGCSKPDARIAALESRIEKLEVEQKRVSGQVSGDLSRLERTMESTVGVLTNVMAGHFSDLYGGMIAEVRNEVALQISRHGEAMAGVPPKRVEGMAAVARQGAQLKRGVPVAIYDQIAVESARKWPANFEMQEYSIGNQIEAYLKLQAAR